MHYLLCTKLLKNPNKATTKKQTTDIQNNASYKHCISYILPLQRAELGSPYVTPLSVFQF